MATGAKRARTAIDDLPDDIDALKAMIKGQDEELERLQDQNKKLKKEATPKSAAKQPPTVRRSSEEEVAVRLRKSISQNLSGQMVYRKGLKYSSSRLNTEIPNLTEAQVRAILGPELCAKASSGPKQLKVDASEEDLSNIKLHFGKSLRYGAMLSLTAKGLSFTFSKSTSVLKVSGMYTMMC